jgi:hypothetical protein
VVALQPARILAAKGLPGAEWPVSQAGGWGRACDLTQSAQLGGPTMEYLEKVRSQFLSLRQHFRTSTFSIGGKAAIPSIKLGLFKNQTVLESAELGDLLPGDGIFLQSFVLRQFSIV